MSRLLARKVMDAVAAKKERMFEKTEVPRREIHSEPLHSGKKKKQKTNRLTTFGGWKNGRKKQGCLVLLLFCKHVFIVTDQEMHYLSQCGQ